MSSTHKFDRNRIVIENFLVEYFITELQTQIDVWDQVVSVHVIYR